MTIPLSIPKNRTVHESEDYAFLRAEGLRYMEELSGKIWTDFNVHDPGVTLEEALCYALTDLGYRTSMDMKDLIAEEGGNPNQSASPLFTARDIMTNNPVTLIDWRKILVDIDGIRNAWLLKADCQEVDFYANCEDSTLNYYQTNHKIKREKLAIKGNGSKVLNDFIDQPDNEETAEITLDFSFDYVDNGNNIKIETTIPLPGWITIAENLNSYLNFINANQITAINLEAIQFNNLTEEWQANATVNFTNQNKIQFNNILIKGIDENQSKIALENFLQSISAKNPFIIYRQKLQDQLARLTEHNMLIKGLMEVLLEYEVEDQFGDLNSDFLDIKMVLPAGTTEETFNLESLMPSWSQINANLEQFLPFINGLFDKVEKRHLLYDDTNDLLHLDLEITFPIASGITPIFFNNLIVKGVKNRIHILNDSDGTNINFPLFIDKLIQQFQAKLHRLREIDKAVWNTLHQHRNLCEDFKKVSGIYVNEIGVCVDIILENNANLIETQAKILLKIQQYLSPSIRFYALPEMLDKKIPSETIFNGPKLQHGFILDEEIEQSDLFKKRYIYASDIINLIMDVEGVLAAKDLLLTKYDKKGNPVQSGEKWCLAIDYKHKAELGIDKSKILFFKEELPYSLSGNNYERMLARLARLKVIEERYKIITPEKDFPIPEGTPLNLADYSPLRLSLPQTYGVGITGLPETATPVRKGKAKQLQAYLAFFDQLLANYLSQLGNLNELFSAKTHNVDKLKKTYYNQFLTGEQLGNTDFYIDAATLEDSTGATIGTRSLQRLTESKSDYLDRRNRFLDHLLARFGESFADYALLVFNVLEEEEEEQLINDKVQFLKDLPVISSERGKAFNYKDLAHVWDTDNVVGLKKRLSKLLGMEEYLRQDFHCPTIWNGIEVVATGGEFSYTLKENSTTILEGTKAFDSEEEAFCAKEKAIELGLGIDNYAIVESSPGVHHFQIGIIDPLGLNNDIYAQSITTFPTTQKAMDDAQNLVKKLNNEFDGQACEVEGMHIIEHILLRPKSEYKDDFFEVCLDKDCFFCGAEDPYSFRISVILPYWMERFVDAKLTIRDYVDRLIRQETPAHIQTKICWVSNFHMRQLDLFYRRWLEENAKEFPDSEILSIRLNCLIELLGKLRNVYPEAYLHDCDDGEQESTIVLGKTFLGSFKPAPENE